MVARMLSVAVLFVLLAAGTGQSVVRVPGIGDFVWEDLNGNGIQDAGEPGVEGVTVILTGTDSTGTAIYLETQTDADGHYLFAPDYGGTYQVTFELPPGFAFTLKDQGTNDEVDSDADPTTGKTDSIVLPRGGGEDPETWIWDDMTWDAGLVRVHQYIGDFVWEDLNANGIQDAGEPGVEGVTVILTGTDSTGTAIYLETQTDADGHYLFAPDYGGTYQVTFELPTGFAFTLKDQGTDDKVDSDANPTTGETDLITLPAGKDDRTWDAGLVRVPDLTLTKTADVAEARAGKPVTYTYVVTNTGGVTLKQVVIKDDNGTPAFAGDDFTVGTLASLAPGESKTFTVTTIPPLCQCMVVNGQTVDVGTLSGQILPSGDVKVVYRQSRNVVDNTYGTNISPGWSRHNFSDLVGSDKAEFRFTKGDGQVVLDFYVDYISLSANYPSGYGTLGVTGGDGKMLTGSASNVLSADTTISANLNQAPAFYGYTTNSPAEPNPAWDYVDGYTVVVSGAAFGASGFGGVSIPLVHDSPSKLGFNAITPTPCDSTVTNTATVTATANGTTITETATETVLVIGQAPRAGGDEVEPGTPVFAGKTMTVSLTNTSEGAAIIEKLLLGWPAANRKIVKVQLNGVTIFDKRSAPPSVLITQWKGAVAARTIQGGATAALKFEFEANASTVVGNYDLGIDFGDGMHVMF